MFYLSDVFPAFYSLKQFDKPDRVFFLFEEPLLVFPLIGLVSVFLNLSYPEIISPF